MTDQDLKSWKTPKLVSFLEEASLAYREGSPIIDDDTYDHVYYTHKIRLIRGRYFSKK